MGQAAGPSAIRDKEGNGRGVERLESRSPVNGELLGTVPVMKAPEVRRVVERARLAQQTWGLLSIEERGERLIRYRDALVESSEELVELLAREAGKPKTEGLLHEVAAAAELITAYVRMAPRVLAPEVRTLHLLRHKKSFVRYVPRGVVGVLSPYNFPMNLLLRDVTAALIAGNAAVVKPSEVTSLIALELKRIWDASGMPADLFGIVTGRGPTGAALIDAGIDLCVFTGSVATGRRVAAACGERLIECILELGGKAPLIACEDCDVDRTARAIVHGGFANLGQVCLSVERVYAHERIHDALVARVVELTRQLRIGDPVHELCDIGALTFEPQMAVAERHIADALAKGAELCVGGRSRGPSRLGFEPTVLSGCTEDMMVMREEIFGPIVPIMKVGSDEEAILRANDSPLGLNAYVFTEDRKRGRRIAERLEAGSVLVNDVLVNGIIAEAPFGGMKHSGLGRVLGPEGLRAMCHAQHVCVDRVRTPVSKLLGFPYTEGRYRYFAKALRAMYHSGGVFRRLGELMR